MFEDARAFNQPLSFDTSKVKDVRISMYCFKSDRNERPDSDYLFPIQLTAISLNSCFMKQKPSINQ